MFGKVAASVVGIGFILWAGNLAAQGNGNRNPSPAGAVKYCVNFVHHARAAEPFMQQFYDGFDAYYDPNTGKVYNNSTTVGDQKAVFVFDKCMADQGFFLKN